MVLQLIARRARAANILRRGPDDSQSCARPSHYPDVRCAIPHYPGYHFQRLVEWFHASPELVAKLTGQLDESARVNIALVQQQQAEAEQELMLERLTIAERLELRRLVAKAQGEEEFPGTSLAPQPESADGAGQIPRPAN